MPPRNNNAVTKKNVNGNKKTLIIVESPAKCGKIEGYLGRDSYTCMASYGHIREIENGLKSINTDNDFDTKFAIMKTKYAQVSKLRAALADSSDVILATDDDREGEAIAWHLCVVLNLSIDTTKRIVFHEITESALKLAVSQPRTINMPTVHAQQARQILDMIVGYKVSPVLWTYIAHTNLSAGRCQTPALRLVYDNHKEIESSPSVMVYSVAGIFTKLNLTFTLSKELDSIESLERFLRETADSPDTSFVASVSTPKKITKSPPKPYSTSTLQQAANNEIHLSPKDTMSVAQKLYEQGFITYMRTDSKVYSRDFVNKAFDYIKKRWSDADREDYSDLLGNLSNFTSGASTDAAAHEAIRPTDISRTLLPQSSHPREHRLYSMIHRNTLESIMAAATGQSITMSIQSPFPSDAEYRYTAEHIIRPGWKLVSGYDKESKEYTYFASLSSTTLKDKLIFPYKKITTKCSMRNTKSHHSEAGLVQTLEKMGIGRPSTYSSLIEKIQERGYVKVQDVRGKSLECTEFILYADKKIERKTEVREIGGESRKLVIQPLGIMVIEFLLAHFDQLFDYEFTKNMETQLDEVETGGMVWSELCYKCWFDVNSQLQELKERGVVKEEIRIDDNHSYIIGKFGPVIKCTIPKKAGVHKSLENDDDNDDNNDNDDDNDDDNDAAISEKEKEKVIFKPVRKDLEYSKILRGEYSLEYMLGNENAEGQTTGITSASLALMDNTITSNVSGGRLLGTYQGNNVIIKNGKYGPYVAWGTQNFSLRNLLGMTSVKTSKFAKKEQKQTKSEFDLTLPEVIQFINSQQDASSSSIQTTTTDDGAAATATATAKFDKNQSIRTIDEHLSIRNGRFGPYIFYKTPKMSKPEFIPLKGFAQKHGDYLKCDSMVIKEWFESSRNK
jgi:DNA topoisomerase-1